MRLDLAVLLALIMTTPALSQPPAILLIVREPLKPGSEAEYRKIERETANAAVELGCPHPYLALESLNGPKEIWWLNGFDSPADYRRVGDAYTANQPWSELLKRNSERKKAVTLPLIQQTVRYREDLSRGPGWTLGHGRFLVISASRDKPALDGTVFAADDGTLYVIRSAPSRKAAEALARSAGAGARVLATRPEYSFAAKEWIAHDPGLWKPRGAAVR
jgi:hypothetical protein